VKALLVQHMRFDDHLVMLAAGATSNLFSIDVLPDLFIARQLGHQFVEPGILLVRILYLPRSTLQIRPNVDGANPAIGAGAQAGVL
jgi:hypothetical protein